MKTLNLLRKNPKIHTDFVANGPGDLPIGRDFMPFVKQDLRQQEETDGIYSVLT